MKVFFTTTFVILISININFTAARSKRSIIGAIESERSGISYQSAILVPGTGSTEVLKCGGAIIGPNLIATSGYCIIASLGYIKQPLKIITNSTNLNATNDGRRIGYAVKYYVPYNFESTSEMSSFEVVVIEVNATIAKSKEEILELPDVSGASKFKEAVVSGYGYDVLTNQSDKNPEIVYGYSSNSLRYAPTTIMSEKDCKKSFPLFSTKTICARVNIKDGKPHGICRNDNGDPLVAVGKGNKKYLIGLAALNNILCDETKTNAQPGMYTRTDTKEVLEFLNAAKNGNCKAKKAFCVPTKM